MFASDTEAVLCVGHFTNNLFHVYYGQNGNGRLMPDVLPEFHSLMKSWPWYRQDDDMPGSTKSLIVGVRLPCIQDVLGEPGEFMEKLYDAQEKMEDHFGIVFPAGERPSLISTYDVHYV